MKITDGKVYLAHQTVKTFLVGNNDSSRAWKHCLKPHDSHQILADICMNLLRFDVFETDSLALRSVGIEEQLRHYTSQRIFLEYAASCWMHHFELGYEGDNSWMLAYFLEMCDQERKIFKAWTQLYWLNATDGQKIPLPADPSPLIIASHAGLISVVRLLLESGVDYDAQDSDGNSAITYAVANGRHNLVKYLASKGADLNPSTTGNSFSTLEHAARRGDTALMHLLVKGKVGSLSPSFNLTDGLTQAAMCGHEDVVLWLLGCGADINGRDRQGRTVLSCACQYKKSLLASVLVSRDADTNMSDSSGRTPLSYSAQAGEIETMMLLIDSGARINSTDSRGRSILSYAADSRQNTCDAVRLVLRPSTNVDTPDDHGRTPLSYATERSETVVRLLWKSGASLDSKDTQGWAPLWHAAWADQSSTVRFLIENGCDVNTTSTAGTSKDATALVWMAKLGRTESVKTLIDAGADVSIGRWNGLTALHFAASNGLDAMVEALLVGGAEVDAKNPDGLTPLKALAMCRKADTLPAGWEQRLTDQGRPYYVQHELKLTTWDPPETGQEMIARRLLERGADPEAATSDGSRALHEAAFNPSGRGLRRSWERRQSAEGLFFYFNTSSEQSSWNAPETRNESLIRLLIAAGASVHSQAANDGNALVFAAEHSETIRLLLDEGAQLNLKGRGGETVLCRASGLADAQVVKLLLVRGADPEIKTDAGMTATHCAALHGKADNLKLLLEKGAEIDVKDNEGQTPLILAAMKGHEEAARLLISYGANVSAKEEDGWTPLHFAAKNGHSGMIRLLLRSGAEHSVLEKIWQKMPLHFAASKGQSDAVIALLNGGVDCDCLGKGHEKWTALHYAANAGHEHTVKVLLQRGANPDAVDFEDWTALHMAAAKGFEPVVKVLLAEGAKVTFNEAACQNTGLHLASLHNHDGTIRALIQGGADPEALDADSFTPLQIAVNARHESAVRTLVENGASPNVKKGFFPLIRAVSFKNAVMVKALLELGHASTEVRDEDGWTPMHYAANTGCSDIIKILLQHGANPNDTYTEPGESPLWRAVVNRHEDAAQVLLQQGHATTEAMDDEGWTALHIAANKDLEKIIRLLMDHGANPNAKELTSRKNPLHLAIDCNNEASVKALLHYPQTDPDAQEVDNWTPLHFASTLGHANLVTLLLERGANANAVNLKKESPLYKAIDKDHISAAEVLLQIGHADPDIKEEDGWTALHSAAIRGREALVKLLVANGANVNMKNDKSNTPLNMAVNKSYVSVVRLLLQWGRANTEVKDGAGCTPMHSASAVGNAEITSLLLDSRANVNAEDNDKWAPLHFASSSGHDTVVELLLARGANIKAKTSDGRSALHMAANMGRMKCIELLLKHGANVKAKTNKGQTPRMLAELNHKMDAMSLLDPKKR